MVAFGTTTSIKVLAMKFSAVFFITLLVGLTGCADSLNRLAYHPDVPQGNIIPSEQIKKLAVGMTQAEVAQIVGTPLLSDPFHANRWDYIYRTTSSKDEISQTALIVFFDAYQKISRIEFRSLN
jgi:outer membrane protein assembly factor BamE (lipoprotein component of BamABCDE complex)